ncbi:MAG: Ig-like domain-containing protein, partial [Gemmatimonadota bacterium]|nr:Ig-like domain-containing protein [Gemmatimonadota bacterium]
SAYNSSGGMVPNKMFAWSSSNAAIASVNNAGLVTAHASGAVVIAANTDNVVGIANMVVASPR